MTSIIICSIDDQKFNAVAQMYGRFFPPEKLRIVRVVDAKSLADGYNRGLRAAIGEHVIFSHDDIEIISPDLAGRLQDHLSRFDIVGVAGTSLLGHPRWLQAGPPYLHGQVAHPLPEGGYTVDIYGASRRVFGGIQALDGLFMAMRRDVLAKLTFDDATFDGFHVYDVDFTFRAHLAGYKLAVACDIQVLHQSAGQYDKTWEIHARRFLQKHQSALAKMPDKEFCWGWAKVEKKDDIRGVMTPLSWDDGK